MYVRTYTYISTVNITTKYVCTYIRMYALPLLTVYCLISLMNIRSYFSRSCIFIRVVLADVFSHTFMNWL